MTEDATVKPQAGYMPQAYPLYLAWRLAEDDVHVDLVVAWHYVPSAGPGGLIPVTPTGYMPVNEDGLEVGFGVTRDDALRQLDELSRLDP